MEVLVKEGLRRRVRQNKYDDEGEVYIPPRMRELKSYIAQSSGSTLNSALAGVMGSFTDWDTVSSVLTPTTHMILIAQGTGNNQRIGDAIDLDSLDFRITFQAGTNNFDVRLWLIWQHQNCLTIPNAQQIFFGPQATGFSLNGVMCILNPNLESLGYELLHEHHLNSSMEGYYTLWGQLQHDFHVDLRGLRSTFVPGFNFPANGTMRLYLASRSVGAGNPTVAASYILNYRDAE